MRYRAVWLLAIFFSLVCMVLCTWQLHRGYYKQQLLTHKASAATLPLLDFAELLSVSGNNPTLTSSSTYQMLADRRVSFLTQADSQHIFLLDNRIRDGQVGYEVLMLAKVLQHNYWVIVNRGWVAASPQRSQLPDIASLPDPWQVNGSVYMSDRQPFVLSSQLATANWPKVVQVADPLMLKQFLPHDFLDLSQTHVYPYVLRLAPESVGALMAQWPQAKFTAQRHYGYAGQWFLLALVLMVIAIYNRRRGE